MWVALLGGLLTIAGSLVGRVLLALGMGYVTYKGFDLSVSFLLTLIKNNFSGMGPEVLDLLAFLWVDKAIGMIFSAYTAALVVKTSAAGKITKLVTKG